MSVICYRFWKDVGNWLVEEVNLIKCNEAKVADIAVGEVNL